MSEYLLEVENVWKKFPRSLAKAARYGVSDIFRELSGTRLNNPLRDEEFWSLQDVSFSLKRGECLGVLGHNGAGKTTLLKVVSNLIAPDKGRVTARGRMDRVISVSGNLSPMLTGEENLKLAAATADISSKDFPRIREEVIEFAEAQEYIGMPVAFYSSGMKARLGFATATLSRPDILLLDEVLAVGDLGFRLKCYDRIYKLIDSAAVMFVSHSMNQVNRICTRGMFLEKGRVKFSGGVAEAIETYTDSFSAKRDKKKFDKNPEKIECSLLADNRQVEADDTISKDEDICLDITFKDLPMAAEVRIVLVSNTGYVMEWPSYIADFKVEANDSIRVELGKLSLARGSYRFRVMAVSEGGRDVFALRDFDRFSTNDARMVGIPLQAQASWAQKTITSQRNSVA